MQALAGSTLLRRIAFGGPSHGLAGRSRSVRPAVLTSAGKGFGDKQQRQRPTDETEVSEAATTSSSSSIDVDAALAQRRSRRKIQPQVKVESATVAQATGQAPRTEIGELETNFVQALAGFFGILLVEGLALAASGFLPEDWDAFIETYLYPSFSPQMLAFLGASSLYGLWKTGKLPGQKQM